VRRFAPQLFAQFFCIALALLCISQSQAAQMSTRRAVSNQTQDRGLALDLLRQLARRQPARNRQPIAPEVREDFRKLQIVNNALMAGVFERTPTERITNKEIRSSLGEIKKLAQRLADNFSIPTTKAKSKPDTALTVGLLELDKAVMSFVNNPMFEQLRVYDTEHVSQAGRDLSEVLRLAEVLRSLAKDD
jgi:hypothetical protein